MDKNTITISTGHTQPLLIEGPTSEASETKPKTDSYTNIHYKVNDLNLHVATPYLLLGHYKVPELTTTWVPPLPNTNFLNIRNTYTSDSNAIKLINGQVHTETAKDVDNETNLKSNQMSVAVQTENPLENMTFRPDLLYREAYVWLNQQENKGLKFILIILVGLVITLFWHLRYQVSFLSFKRYLHSFFQMSMNLIFKQVY